MIYTQHTKHREKAYVILVGCYVGKGNPGRYLVKEMSKILKKREATVIANADCVGLHDYDQRGVCAIQQDGDNRVDWKGSSITAAKGGELVNAADKKEALAKLVSNSCLENWEN